MARLLSGRSGELFSSAQLCGSMPLEHAHVRIQRIALKHHGQIALAGSQMRDLALLQMQLSAINAF